MYYLKGLTFKIYFTLFSCSAQIHKNGFLLFLSPGNFSSDVLGRADSVAVASAGNTSKGEAQPCTGCVKTGDRWAHGLMNPDCPFGWAFPGIWPWAFLEACRRML